jgi:hypothetical protein
MRVEGASRFGVSMFATLSVLVVINYFAYLQQSFCADCVVSYGLPFKFTEEGGFVTVRRFLWGGVVGDLVVVLATAAVITWAWKRFSRIGPG